MLTYPVVDPVGYSSRGGDCRHRGALPVPLFVAKTRTRPSVCGQGRGLGNPHRKGISLCYEGSAKVIHGRGKSSSRNVRHDQPVRHTRLEMLEYAGLSSRHADRQRLAVCHAKLDDVGAVAFRTVVMMRSWPPGGAMLISGAPLTNPPRLPASRPVHPTT